MLCLQGILGRITQLINRRLATLYKLQIQLHRPQALFVRVYGLPPDGEIINISRTVGEIQAVNEDLVRFTHTEELDWILPGVAPTNLPVEVAMVVIVGVVDGKVTHEHIYWDQASLLVQIGLLDPTGLPIAPSNAAKLLDPSLPNLRYT